MESKNNEIQTDITAITDENRSEMESHKRVAFRLQKAAKYHLEAVKHYSNGDIEKAAQSKSSAQNYHRMANEEYPSATSDRAQISSICL